MAPVNRALDNARRRVPARPPRRPGNQDNAETPPIDLRLLNRPRTSISHRQLTTARNARTAHGSPVGPTAQNAAARDRQFWRVKRRGPTWCCSLSQAPWTGTSGMLASVPPRRVMGRAFWSDPRIFDEYRSPVRARLHADVPGRAMSPARAQIVSHGHATHRPDVSSARACVMRSHASSPAAW